jgi:7-cyano-7-deazaguanine reductase
VNGDLTQLGEKVGLPSSPDAAVIECVPWSDGLTFCQFDAPEWTGLCPVTGQPDFGRILVDYVPDKLLIESKSLKLFLGSFRNHGCFHESVVQTIAAKLFLAAKPRWLRVRGVFNPRGGIGINAAYAIGDYPEAEITRNGTLKGSE